MIRQSARCRLLVWGVTGCIAVFSNALANEAIHSQHPTSPAARSVASHLVGEQGLRYSPSGHHHSPEAHVPPAAPILIRINPEVRVSVTRSGALPAPVACGQPLELPVRIINDGFLMATLEAHLVDPAPEGVSIEFPAQPLRGAPEEHRVLRVTLEHPGPVDLTVAFRARQDKPDLGGRDRVHLLLDCKS